MPSQHLPLLLTLIIGLPTIFTFLALLKSYPQVRGATEHDSEQRHGFRAFSFFNTPASLFPPSAIISLTDDNSTFFLARPADFGPPLQAKGLSAELWLGNGFGDEGPEQRSSKGELGCSDLPGWDGSTRVPLVKRVHQQTSDASLAGLEPFEDPAKAQDDTTSSPEADGTDDYLQHPFIALTVPTKSSSLHVESDQSEDPTHADIETIQEAAEISGKIVLLTRGGCGFLEKVRWAQRRGAVSVIVGDHTRGGALVTMYARGDTSNVTIPSIFTSYTTAQLLASLVSPLPSKFETGKERHKRSFWYHSRSRLREIVHGKDSSHTCDHSFDSSKDESAMRLRWKSIMTLVFGGEDRSILSDSRRPPSSGQLVGGDNAKHFLHWKQSSASLPHNGKEKVRHVEKDVYKARKPSADTFLIGVQDWRDPDLLTISTDKSNTAGTAVPHTPIKKVSDNYFAKDISSVVKGEYTGGSITPGSGEYRQTTNAKLSKHHTEAAVTQTWRQTPTSQTVAELGRQGLWITLTPTTISASPFFDTLLVLVVSPLITLTVVYAMLYVRARIRRQRWRAPKSIVDQLPVRTYHHSTSSDASVDTSNAASPRASSSSVPLLCEEPNRSSGSSDPEPHTHDPLEIATSHSPSTHQCVKDEKKPAKPKRKFRSRQKECVVCLEEYIDGQSQVMSLPCGHEFHAECITPWLTTRRRTCPICKGDVVRFMMQAESGDDSLDGAGTVDEERGEVLADEPYEYHGNGQSLPSSAIIIPGSNTAQNMEAPIDLAATLVDDTFVNEASRVHAATRLAPPDACLVNTGAPGKQDTDDDGMGRGDEDAK